MSEIGDRFKSAISLEALHGKAILHAPRIAAFALALALLGQAAVIVTRFVHIRATGQRFLTPVGSPRALAPGRRGPNVAAAIMRAHLFGAPPRALANRGVAAETRLPLVLSGTLAARDPKSGLAILGPTTTATKLYAVGQGLPGGARLHAVYTAWVLIDRDGTIETLRLPQGTAPGIARGNAPVPAPEPVADDTPDEPPTIIGGAIRPQAVRGRHGFVLYPGDNAAAFAALGLEQGDFVTAVDGQPIESQLGGGRLLGALNTASTARLTIVRDGVERQVNLNLAQAAAQLNDTSGE